MSIFCCWCSNSSKFVTNNSNYIQTFVLCCHIYNYNNNNVAYASSDKTKIVWIEMELLLFSTWGGCISCLCVCLGARSLPQSYQYPNLSEGADRIGGQLRGDKECPFSGVTKSGSVWRKVPESDAWSVGEKVQYPKLSLWSPANQKVCSPRSTPGVDPKNNTVK